jgi:hypothetical protein
MSSGQARLGFGIAGAVIGSFFGVPGLGFVAGSALGATLFPEDPTVVDGPRLNELQVAVSEYGNPIPIIYGAVRLGGNYFWATDIVEKVKTTKESAGGKGGGGGGTVTREYFYSGNFGVMFCETADRVLQIFADNKLIVDFTNETGPVFSGKYTSQNGPAGFSTGAIRIHMGDEDQAPDPLIETFEGVGNVSASRGVVSIIFEDFPLADFGNRIPQITAVICAQCLEPFPQAEMQWNVNTNSVVFDPTYSFLHNRGTDNTPELVLSGPRQFLIADSGGVRSLEPLVGSGNNNGNAWFGFYDIDRRGRGITEDEDLASVSKIGMHDVHTGAILGRGEQGSSFDTRIVNGLFSARFFGPNDSRIMVVGLGVEDNELACFSTETALVSQAAGNTFDGPFMARMSKYNTADLGFSGDCNGFPVIDRQTAEVYFIAIDGSDTKLVKCDINGNPAEIFTITGRSCTDIGYCDTNHAFVLHEAGTGDFIRWDIDTESVSPLTFHLSNASPGNAFWQESFDGLMYMSSGSGGGHNVRLVDVTTMTIVKEYRIFEDWGRLAQNHTYDPILHATIASPTLNLPTRWFFLDRASPDGVPLRLIVEDICVRAGLTLADVDAVSLTDLVKGFVISNRQIARRAIETLQPLYFFDSVETDHILKFPKRGTAAAANLLDADLGAKVSGSKTGVDKLSKQRLQEVELPQRMEVTYIDPDFEYQEGLQAAHRAFEVVTTRRVTKQSFPVVMSADEAAQRAEIMLFNPWLERTTYRLQVGPEHLYLDPGDQITVTADGEFHSIRITQTQFGANGLYRIEGRGFKGVSAAEVDSIYQASITLDATTTGGAPSGVTPQAIESAVNPPDLVVIDAPALRGSDATDFGQYLAVTGLSDPANFSGALIDRSDDGDVFAEYAFYPETQNAEIGGVQTAVGDHLRWTVMDTVNTIVATFPGTVALSSVSLLDLMNFQNLYYVGGEYIGVQTWVDGGDGVWTGSNLLRGRFGTESQIGSHVDRERIVVIDTLKIFRKEMDAINTGVEYTYSSLSFDAPIGSIPTLDVATYLGINMYPYPPANPVGVKSGSDWNFSWIERSRAPHEWRDSVDTASSEAQPDWQVDILNEAGAVVRTITSTASANGSVVDPATFSAVYDQLDLEADFGESPIVSGYPLYRIQADFYMYNAATVGRGYGRRVVMEDFPDPLTADADYSNVSLLLHCNDLVVKDKGVHKLGFLTVDANVLLETGGWSDGVSQFGSANLRFPLTGKVSLPRAVMGDFFNFGTGEWTVEAWAKRSTFHDGVIVGIWDTASKREWKLSWESSGANGRVRIWYSTTGVDAPTIFGEMPTGDVNILHHVAACRDASNNLDLYLDGLRVATTTIGASTAVYHDGPTGADLVVGVDDSGANQLNGNVDAVRVTKGVARYTGATYTPPTTRFSNG